MARPKYSITAADVVHAASYLKPRLQTFAMHLLDDAPYRTAEKAFTEAIEVKAKEERATRLNAWCEKYLPTKEWVKLKTAIRKRRERKTRLGELKSISITDKAFGLLQKLSERDNVTYSDTLEHYLEKAVRGKARL